MTPELEPAEKPRLRARLCRAAGVLWPEGRRVLALFGTAFIIGAIYVSTWGGPPEFWQQVFGPSVMMACGHGFTNPDMAEVPGLEDFLYLRAETFDCANIPEDVTLLPQDTSGMSYDAIQAFHPLQQFPGWIQWQRFHKYLLLSVAFCFMLFGVAWQSLTPLYALLYATTNALGYGIFRLGMGPRTATLFSALLMTSPVHLQQLPQLRDYSKAPFFFVIILAAGWLLTRPMRLRYQVPLAALAGLLAGLGLGFRQDVSIAAGLFCGLVLLFSPGHLKATGWKRVAVVAVFIGAFAILGLPIIQVLSRVNNATHDTIIGFTHYCDERLGVGAPLYDFGDPFLDEYVRAELMGYAYRTEGRTEIFRHYSEPYDAAGKAYFREMIFTFPADLIVRAYASVLRIVDELQISSPDATPRGVTNQFLARLWQVRQWALDSLPGGGRYHVALMLVLLSAVNPRLAAAALCAILLLAGYPALRFSERHAFHMEIVALFAAGYLLYWGVWAARAAWVGRKDIALGPMLAAGKVYGVRSAVFVVVVALLLTLPLFAARWWQARQAPPLLSAYENAPRSLLIAEPVAREDASTFVALPGFGDVSRHDPGRATLPMCAEVLVLEFLPGPEAVDVHFAFTANHPNFQFDRTMTVPASPPDANAPTRLYYPVYYGEDPHFLGFSMPTASAGRFQAAYRLTDLGGMRILLNAVLPPGWEEIAKYQDFTR